MLSSQQQEEHIRRKIEQVAILISVLRANYFINTTEKDLAVLGDFLYSKLKGPLEKLEEKIKIPAYNKVKKTAKKIQVGIDQLSHFFENSYSRQEKIASIALFSNLFLSLNLLKIVSDADIPNDFNYLTSFASKSLQRLSFYLEDKELIKHFNQATVAGDVRSWADLKDFTEKEPYRCFLSMFDLYFCRETLPVLQSFFIEALVNPLRSRLMHAIKKTINAAPVPPPRKKNANVTQPKSIDVYPDRGALVSPIAPPRRNRAHIQLEGQPVPSIPPVRPERGKKLGFSPAATTSNENSVTSSTEPSSSNTPRY